MKMKGTFLLDLVSVLVDSLVYSNVKICVANILLVNVRCV